MILSAIIVSFQPRTWVKEKALERHILERPGLKSIGKELRLKTVRGMPGQREASFALGNRLLWNDNGLPRWYGYCVEAQFCGGGFGLNSNRSIPKPISRPCAVALECGETAVVAQD